MFLVDSHCHLDYPSMAEHIEETLKRAHSQNVKGFLTICTDLSKASALIEMAEKHDNVYATLGVHPHEVKDTLPKKELFKFLIKGADHPKVIGFGETGLDYYYSHSPQREQQSAFQTHIEAALECDLPLIVHTRDAEKDTIDLLKTIGQGKAKGVIHCFSGSAWLRDQALDLGFYISASGILTFKKAEALRHIFKETPLDKLLVETDAPYLAPEPYRGKPNEPAYIIETVKKLAELKQISSLDVGAHTTQNFITLFSKAKLLCA